MLSARRRSRRPGPALLRLLFLTLAATSGCTTTSRHYVRDARIAPSSRGDGNWIEPGSSTVLLLREYDPGGRFTIDDEKFEKLTVELPYVRAGDRFRLGDQGVRVLLTEGASGWAPGGGYCVASTGTGEIAIVSHSESRGVLVARLALVLDCESRDRVWKFPVRQVRVDGEHSFRAIAYDDLAPWLGRDRATGYRGFAVYPDVGR
ncbi:MAG: hypothetical protein U0842_19395 [Candidatus Binatia bacterium]